MGEIYMDPGVSSDLKVRAPKLSPLWISRVSQKMDT